jgi:hypothetical protein
MAEPKERQWQIYTAVLLAVSIWLALGIGRDNRRLPRVLEASGEMEPIIRENVVPSFRDEHPYTFGGLPCTDDCSGHLAGFRWAKQQRVKERSTCWGGGSTSKSFSEGCEFYLWSRGRIDLSG